MSGIVPGEGRDRQHRDDMHDRREYQAGERRHHETEEAGAQIWPPAGKSRGAPLWRIVADGAHRQSTRVMRGRLLARVSPVWLEIGVS